MISGSIKMVPQNGGSARSEQIQSSDKKKLSCFHERGFCNAQKSAYQAGLTVAGKCGHTKTEGVQVVEGVGLVASGFQFFTPLAAVFAEEVGCFGFAFFDGLI